MTVATLIAVLQGCRPDAQVVYPNMEINEKITITKVTEMDKGKGWPSQHRYYVEVR